MNQPVCPFLCRLKIYPAASLLRWIVAVKDTKFLTAAQKALVSSGFEAPIVSFNNSILSVCASPRLTSIDLMLDTMCSTAIHMLFDNLNGKRIPSRVVIAPVIVERDTFKPTF